MRSFDPHDDKAPITDDPLWLLRSAHTFLDRDSPLFAGSCLSTTFIPIFELTLLHCQLQYGLRILP